MADTQNWDSGGTFDSGLQYDVNVFPSNGDIQPYLDLITSQHDDKPNFMAVMAAILQPLADNIYNLSAAPAAYDIDNAAGIQLDVVGEWVGRSRNLSVALPNVYFSFDTVGLGFDEGAWLGPFDPTTGLVTLSDPAYRTLLRAVIAANNWDGTIPSAYAVWDIVFDGTGYQIIIIDNQDMSMYIGLAGPALDAVTLALLTGGYLDLKPAGVRIAGYFISSVPDTPMFGFDLNTSAIGGFDTGAWATKLDPT